MHSVSSIGSSTAATAEFDRIGAIDRLTIADHVQPRDVPLGGEFERRGQQVLLGLEVVRRRRQRQAGHLGHPAVGDRIGTDLADDLEHRFKHSTSRRATPRGRVIWAWVATPGMKPGTIACQLRARSSSFMPL